MDSSTSRQNEEARRQAEIRKQIAVLQAQLKNTNGEVDQATLPISPHSPKRKQPEPAMLAPATPSPRKKKKLSQNDGRYAPSSTRQPLTALQRPHSLKPLTRINTESIPLKPAPSTVLTKLPSSNSRPRDAIPSEILRSSGFSEKPQPLTMEPSDEGIAPMRDDRLALVEELEIGPTDHKPSFDDPHFEYLEPNSGIRLSSRIISHEDIQEYLTGRYYLCPSRLYSVIRLLPNKQGYDVPVSGDWVTIAVVAERGPIKFSRAPIGIGRDDGNGMLDDDQTYSTSGSSSRTKGKRREEPTKSSGKKYVNIKLVDFGARSRSSSSATGGKAVIRGDAFLTLLLFESDGYDLVDDESGKRAKKVYKGGSRGAFEAMSKLKEGDVIALLNSKILKPFQRSSDTPHPISNILALTPESASSIAVIGKARDLGMCTVTKRDGKVCGSWCDKRVSDVCEYHVQNAVERRRAGRAEFSVGTSGMSTSAGPKRKPAYDPARQWGLKPAEPSESTGSTYVISGHIVNSSGADSRSLFVTENMGREGQAKARRKLAGKDADLQLKLLVERDKEGMRAVVKAREVGMKRDTEEGRKGEKAEGKSSKKSRKSSSIEEEDKVTANGRKTSFYTADVIRHLGFDPAIKPGQSRVDNSTVQKKLEALASVHSSKKEVQLGPRPGQRIRSGVFAPPNHPRPDCSKTPSANVPDMEESDDEIERTHTLATVMATAPSKMVNLDDSSDLEVEPPAE